MPEVFIALMTAFTATVLLVMGYDVFRKGREQRVKIALFVGLALAVMGALMLTSIILQLCMATGNYRYIRLPQPSEQIPISHPI